MKRKWGIISTICLIMVTILVLVPGKPRLINSITTMESAYLTILVNRVELFNVEKLERKLVQMCRDNYVQERKLIISVYCSRYALKQGKAALIFTYEEGE